MVPIKKGPYSNPGNYTKGRTNKIEYIVMHYTANDGDTDEGNANYFKNNNIKVSAHYFIDENSITESVKPEDIAYHIGNKSYVHLKCRNYNSIGVEMCSDKVNGRFTITEQTVKNAVDFVKLLMKQYNIPIENVLRHYDITYKKCPEPWVRNSELWINFKESLLKEDDEEMTQEQFNQMYKNMLNTQNGDKPSEYAKEACEKAKKKKIFNGDGKGNYDWQEPISKEQVAILLNNIGLLD
jgi:N-acetylmuramoyl-L-alanine amidase